MDDRQQRRAAITQRYIDSLGRIERRYSERIRLALDRNRPPAPSFTVTLGQEQDTLATMAKAFAMSPQEYLDAHHGGSREKFSLSRKDAGHEPAGETIPSRETVEHVAAAMGVEPPQA